MHDDIGEAPAMQVGTGGDSDPTSDVIQISENGDNKLWNMEKEMRDQANRANRVAGCLNDMVWRNIYKRKQTRESTKSSTKPRKKITTAETRPDTKKIRDMLETAEIKTLKRSSE